MSNGVIPLPDDFWRSQYVDNQQPTDADMLTLAHRMAQLLTLGMGFEIAADDTGDGDGLMTYMVAVHTHDDVTITSSGHNLSDCIQRVLGAVTNLEGL